MASENESLRKALAGNEAAAALDEAEKRLKFNERYVYVCIFGCDICMLHCMWVNVFVRGTNFHVPVYICVLKCDIGTECEALSCRWYA